MSSRTHLRVKRRENNVPNRSPRRWLDSGSIAHPQENVRRPTSPSDRPELIAKIWEVTRLIEERCRNILHFGAKQDTLQGFTSAQPLQRRVNTAAKDE